MRTIVSIPNVLQKITDGKEKIDAQGGTVDGIIADIVKQYPGMKERIFDNDGNVRRFINIYVNEEDIRFLDNLQTAVKEGDEISIIPAIAGGAEIKKKVYLTYPQKLIKEPIIWEVGHRFKIVTNIRGASVSDELGLVALELDGEEQEVQRAIEFFKSKGVKIEPIEKDVIE